MTAQQQATQVFTVITTGAIAKKRAVSRTGAQAGAGVPILGFADTDADSGVALRVIGGLTAIAESGAAIDGTVRSLKTDAQGRLIPTAAGTDVVAALLMPGQTATDVGQLIEVIPIISSAV